MSLTSYIHKRLVDLLEEKRVVVWFDGEKAFGEIAEKFAAPGCTVISCVESQLKARRRADEVMCQLNDAAGPSHEKNGSLLIYVPFRRGKTEEDRLQDAFEGFAVIGTAFGDKEGEGFQSLARQANPSRTTEIDRLFDEGRPTLSLIEGLGEAIRYPLLHEAVGTDSAVEVVALMLGRDGSAKRVEAVVGAKTELLRLLNSNMGFVPPSGTTNLMPIVENLGRFLFFSEFAFDLPSKIPDSLNTVARAAADYRDRVYAACERMRGSDDTREGYIELARRVEQELRLIDFVAEMPKLGTRDTFPFEEKAYLAKLVRAAVAGDLVGARAILEGRRQSIWRQLPERMLLWKLAERCVDFLASAETANASSPKSEDSVRTWVQAYTESDGLYNVDRYQRLVEQGAAECAENDEINDVVSLCRQRYVSVIGAGQTRFIRSVQKEGWPPEGVLRQTQIFDKYVGPVLADRGKVAYFLVDSMRYEMGRDLAKAFEPVGSVSVGHASTVLPTATPCGMAALMPGADGTFALVDDGDDVAPTVAGNILRNSGDRMRFLRERFGDRFCELTLGDLLSMPQKKLRSTIGKADLVVVRTQEIDALGEGPSPYLARKLMSEIIGDVRTATDRLIGTGFSNFVFAADHGHVFLPDVAPGDVLQAPPGRWKKVKRRSLLGASTSAVPGVYVFPAARMGIVGPVDELVVAGGFAVFSAGEGYFHEGVSLQECLVPIVTLRAREQKAVGAGKEEVEIRYRADRFTSRIIGVRVWFNALLQTSTTIRLAAYDGSGAQAKVVGESADCDSRDPSTGLLTLERGRETQVPIRIVDQFAGVAVEIRATDPATGAVLSKLKLTNSLME